MAVEFEDNGYTSSGGQKKIGAVTKLVMRLGLARTPQKANKIMLIIILLGFLWTGYYFVSLGANTNEEIIYREDLTQEQLQTLPREIINSLPSRN